MEYRFDFDEQLPDLPLAFDMEAVRALFEEHLLSQSQASGPSGTVSVARMQDAKYQPSRRCVTTYEIRVDEPGEEPRQTIGVLEINPDKMVTRYYPSDPKLPWLAPATDPEGMRQRFATITDHGSFENISQVGINPVRYKPGLHCVFKYQVESPQGVKTYFAKLFAGDADQLIKTISALYEASLTVAGMPRVLPPVAYWPELQMIVQPAVVDGVEFTKHIYDPQLSPEEREYWMRRGGECLAALHSCAVPGEVRTLAQDLEDLEDYLEAMQKVKPELADRYAEAIQAIVKKMDGLNEPDPVPSHGAMRTDQYLIQNRELVLIDLDGFCWSNPARDLGNFLAYLCWKAIRQPEHGAFVESAGRVFLDGYLDARPDLDSSPKVDVRWLSLYQAASLLKIAGRRFRSLTFREWPLVIHLIDAANAALREEVEITSAGVEEDWRGTLVAHLTTSTSTTKFPATYVDKEFPALWGALNAEMMTDELGQILLSMACTNMLPAVSRARLLAYKPGKRGVIRYDLVGTECRQDRQMIFGKLYPEPYMCDRALMVMRYLWNEVFFGEPELCVPQPLGSVPSLSMLVFVPAEGQFLGDLIGSQPLNSPDMFRIMNLAGAWLARLHQSKLPIEKKFRIEDEISNLHDWVDLIGSKYPEERAAASEIATYLLNQMDRIHLDLHSPIHKDFHYEHILIDGGLKVFDFDEIRLGDPNLDLAHFCANFYLLAYRKNKHTAHFSQLQEQFFQSYARQTGWEMGETFLFFYAYTCLKIAKQLCKKRGPRPWPEGDEQRAQVWLILEQGLRTIQLAKGYQSVFEDSQSVMDFSRIRRSGWIKAGRISKLGTSSAAIRVSHKLSS